MKDDRTYFTKNILLIDSLNSYQFPVSVFGATDLLNSCHTISSRILTDTSRLRSMCNIV